MAIDFDIPPEAKAIRERVRKWVHDECIPAEKKLLGGADYKETLGELRKKARAQGLWCPFIPPEHGGMGLGPLANALVQYQDSIIEVEITDGSILKKWDMDFTRDELRRQTEAIMNHSESEDSLSAALPN